MAIPKGTIEDFERIVNYPLKEYVSSFIDFIKLHRFNIINFYSGRSQSPNMESFDALNQLITQTRLLSGVVEGNRTRLLNGKYWELIETLSEIETTIETIDNSSKWLRSAISKGNFNPQVEITRVLRQFQTLENLSSELGSTNRDQDWVRLALRNDLSEESYTTKGGNMLTVDGKNRKYIQLRSVVDNITGKKVYGIDVNRKLSFTNDDLSALSYDDTVKQTVGILSGMRKGMNPEFPEDGIQASLTSGANRNSIPYPIIIRQIYSTFEKDDSLRSIKVTNIDNEQDWLEVGLEVETRLGEVLTETGQI